MTFKEAIRKAVLIEGGKRNLNVADMTEAVGCFLEVLHEESQNHGSSLPNRCKMVGERRFSARNKKKRK